jgi:STE24 endopeptidase
MRTLIGILATFVLCSGTPAQAAPLTDVPTIPPGVQIPDAARPGRNFDVERATDAYLALLPSAQRARSDAYFEGGYWVNFWGTLYAIGACVLMLTVGWSVRIRSFAAGLVARRWLQAALYAIGFAIVLWLLMLPWDWYAGFHREHQYGLSTLSLGRWFGEELKGLLVNGILLMIVVTAIYGLLRRAEKSWPLRATGFTFVFFLFLGTVYPVFIAPLYNDFKPLPAGEVQEAVLSLARANQIPTDNVAWFDASKQTTRISANVSGMFGTTRVSLNDNLLYKTSLPEIKAVVGHEMGHYVLHHALRRSVYMSLAWSLGFVLLEWLYTTRFAGFRTRMGITDRADPAGLPLAVAILAAYMFVAQPLFNHIVYSAEAEADMFGLDAAREPFGAATAAMRLASYRKLDPGPVEELLFYDHPSGRDRVRRAMIWLRENQQQIAPALAAQLAQPAPASK